MDAEGSKTTPKDTRVFYLCNLDSAEDFVDHKVRSVLLNRRSRHDAHDIGV